LISSELKMRRHRFPQPGFTLIELIFVMLIIAIMAALIAPSFTKFGASRGLDNVGRGVVALAQYARAQAISQAKTYRLNFDESSGKVWLTVDDDGSGVFTPPANDWGQPFSTPPGDTIKLQQSLTPPPTYFLNVPATVQETQTTVPQPNGGQLLNGQQGGVPGQLVVYPHANGEYIEFQPNGRTDPATIWLTDAHGQRLELWCGSPTERLQIVPEGVIR
jgi:prepilin-type N-terminal cleavage/methylation domain-containing protein